LRAAGGPERLVAAGIGPSIAEGAAMRVLVAYASKHGATRGIAEHIAAALERSGLEVTLRPADAADGVAGYDACVIGSAAYAGHWLGEATAFVRHHHAALAERPVWLFSSGPIGTETIDEKGRDVLAVSAPQEFAEFRDIHPRDERVFFGAFDPDAEPIGLLERIGSVFMRLPAVRQATPVGDFRDWPAIEAWAEGIARELRPATASSAERV
jgi:menaquinone-dependent protoporphyrinogen oxidase